MVQLAKVDDSAVGVLASNKQLMVFGNRDQNGFAQLIDGPTIDLVGGIESFVSAGTVDQDGNFVLVGAGSNPIVGTLPPINDVLNPDNVIPDPVGTNKSDATNLWYWKIDIFGKIIDSASMRMPTAVIPNSVIADKFGITIAGASYSNPGFSGFVVDWNSNPVLIGQNRTQVFGLVRTGDGGEIVVGQTTETLLGKPLMGKSDGYLAKVLNSKLISLQRSSDKDANRSWQKVTSNLLLGGYSNANAVITKFSSNFTPTWSNRYPSNGSAYTAYANKISYGAFQSAGPFKALPNWKRKNSILVLTFGSKGEITGASSVNSPILTAFTANTALGPVVLAGGFLYRS